MIEKEHSGLTFVGLRDNEGRNVTFSFSAKHGDCRLLGVLLHDTRFDLVAVREFARDLNKVLWPVSNEKPRRDSLRTALKKAHELGESAIANGHDSGLFSDAHYILKNALQAVSDEGEGSYIGEDGTDET